MPWVEPKRWDDLSVGQAAKVLWDVGEGPFWKGPGTIRETVKGHATVEYRPGYFVEVTKLGSVIVFKDDDD